MNPYLIKYCSLSDRNFSRIESFNRTLRLRLKSESILLMRLELRVRINDYFFHDSKCPRQFLAIICDTGGK
ncbi:hypothetical protein BpHYR1_042051 [Brachionus plicatilis]|uniref:Transposase n=1 Tax=Brachionus plicatilis TaxID=10195 RepID=A0A3M7P305_BRAPC|nr:hypothetical protein BpHYR1_042051 [Brachionus plicatilis]